MSGRAARLIIVVAVFAVVSWALGVLAAFGATPDASADPGGTQVRWSTDAVCVDEAVLVQTVASMLEQAPASLAIDLSVTGHADDWSLDLRAESGGVSLVDRTLRSRDCRTLTVAAALVVAVAADPVAAAASIGRGATDDVILPTVSTPPPRDPSTFTEPAFVVAQRAEPVARPGDASKTTPSEPVRLRLGAGIGAAVAALPSVSGLFQLSAGAAWQRLRIEAVGHVSVAPQLQAPMAVTATFRAFAGAVRGCGVLARARVNVAGCGAFEVGAIRARGGGLAQARAVTALWSAVAVGVRPELRLGERASVGLMLEAVVPLTRPRFFVGDSILGLSVHQVPAVGARFGATFAVQLP